MMEFLVIRGEILRNAEIPPASKIILSFFMNLHISQKYYYGQVEALTALLGMDLQIIIPEIRLWIKRGFLRRNSEGIEFIATTEMIRDFRQKDDEDERQIMNELRDAVQALRTKYSAHYR